MAEPSFSPPTPTRQLSFHLLLVEARKTVFLEALQAVLGRVDLNQVNAELARFAPADARALLVAAGIRDEYVFLTPVVLEQEPRLLGYYQLLLGRPQKSFYGGDGFGAFKSMESVGILSVLQRDALSALCKALGIGMANLVRQMTPPMSVQDAREPPLLILGSQFQVLPNNRIGQRATEGVFTAVVELVEASIVERVERRVVVRNSSGRRVRLVVASDPDIRSEEEFGGWGQGHNKVAIEVKGGSDASNAHNRAGEAEKSHQKAMQEGFEVCWTLIALKGVDQGRLRTESPTTHRWFDIGKVRARSGPSWEDFRQPVAGAVGVALSE